MERPAETLAAHHTWLRRVARRIARSSAAADDLVQDTCVTALQNAPEAAEMRPWLRGVMRKLAWGHTRSETRRARREEIFYQHAPPSAGPDPLLEYGVDRRRLAEALETLPEPFRSTVVQRYVEGRSCAEIARAEKVPAGTVRWRQTRALELLRSALEGQQRRGRHARRARILWLLPALGIERVAAALSRALLALSGHAKLAGLVLVGLAVAVGLGLLDESAKDPHASRATALSAAAGQHASGGSDSWSQKQRAERARAERLLAARRALSSDSRPSYLTSLVSTGNAGDREQPGRQPRGRDIAGDSHPAARLLEDCWRDERGELRCHQPPMTATTPGRPTCDSLNRNLSFIDTTRSTRLMNSSYAKRFLTAALLANMTMATSMGCQPYFDGPDGIGSPDRTLELDGPTCETHEGLHGGACTTCIDESGAQTTLCAPADCYTQSLPDGTLCTTCADQAGTSETVCEEPPEQPDEECVTWPMMNRMFCTLCGGEDKGVYCQPAQCVNDAAGCLTCSDADGHSYTTCGPEGDACFGEGTLGFSTRDTCMKTDRTTSVTTRWPGTDTCETFTVNGARCIECVYQGPDVSRSELCLIDPDVELPDPLLGRPDGLPAPGTCVTETSPGGFWSCTTCVLEDGEARQTCDYAPSDTCTVYPMPNELWCSRCTYPDGTFQETCTFP